MFLKSLVLRGFKSFADKTTLEFEPGVTVVVGPNGSGKSNIVDALTWVLGSHSAKSLRGGSMADVIFAGSPRRPGLGRAAVEITIDNSSGRLPIDFSEVTVARAMFANGENEYSINRVPCRLLDVQELLSDTGLGRENHTIVGQGQLDAVLNAKPEERRAFIEEAAGILKHRKRKERALRKLAQMEAHLERLGDVLRELRRNLRPLERQAEAAQKHAQLAEQLRAVRVERAVRELHVLQERWDLESSSLAAGDARLADLDREVAAARAEEAQLEQALARLAPAAQQASETHFRLANLLERYRGLCGRIEERRKGLVDAAEEPIAGRDPDELRSSARTERTVLADLEDDLSTARAALEAATRRRREAEHARRAHEQASAAEARRRTEARERLLRWEGEVAALRSSLAQAASEEGRLASHIQGLEAHRDQLGADAAGVRAEIQRLDADQVFLAEQLRAADEVVQRRTQAADEAAKRERELERQRASLGARADALRAASAEATEGASTLLAAAEAGEIDGVLGPLVDCVRVADGMARAVAAALGPLGDALVVRSRGVAAQAVGFVRSRRSGRVLLLAADDQVADTVAVVADERDRALADLGARPLVEAVSAEPGVVAALRLALEGAYGVADFDAACRLASRHPGLVFVSVGGELAGPRGYAGGAVSSGSAVLLRSAAEQAERQLVEVEAELLVAHRRLGDADRDVEAARRELDAANAAMQESDGLITAAAERQRRLGKEHETLSGQLEELAGQATDLAREISAQRRRLADLEARGPEPVPDEPEGPDLAAERLDDELADAREAEVDARLAASALDQRGQELVRWIGALEAEADDVERQLAEREQRRRQRLAAIERCAQLLTVAQAALQRAEESLEAAVAERDVIEEERAERQRALGAVRAGLRELEDEVSGLREERHADDLRRQELRHELDGVRERLADELGVDPDEALTGYRHEAVAGSVDDADAVAAATDQDLAEREDGLVRKIALLGTVNPLAMQEYEQMGERHRFLVSQIDDLKASKRDLLTVVDAVDERIRDIFAAAFADVAVQFERMFPLLFPGGEGRLVLTAPDDMLDTGVEVEARPPGKRVKRLSLLSGGERSLTALAVLFAIFAARPSPFYVLDEVEAALDDVNLQRFLNVVREFRPTSQIIIVTHQKRTMEVADLLYGISMQGDGVSKVISQRMAQDAPVPAATAGP